MFPDHVTVPSLEDGQELISALSLWVRMAQVGDPEFKPQGGQKKKKKGLTNKVSNWHLGMAVFHQLSPN
jgi:hypothetical protein